MGGLSKKVTFGNSDLEIPPIIFGTSCLGNLYQVVPYETKLDIVRQFFEHVEAPVVLDSAGKYGAGLSLEVIGKTLNELEKSADDVIISNKLGWKRVELKGPLPTFEPGAWFGIEHDAEKCISFSGIIECWEQGCELLGGHQPQLLSVHDPDEYLNTSSDDNDRSKRFDDVIGAYQSLGELKKKGYTKVIGVGSKDWKVIKEISELVDLDWIMLACSLTIYTHPQELLDFIEELNAKNIAIINSAVFNAGFLIGGDYFDYRIPDQIDEPELFAWRDSFLDLCHKYSIKPAEACVQFGLSVSGVCAVALNTSKPGRVKDNVESVAAEISDKFWTEMKANKLINEDFPYLGEL